MKASTLAAAAATFLIHGPSSRRPSALLLLLLLWHPFDVQAIEITANLMNLTYNSGLLAMATMEDDPAAYAEANGLFEVYGTFPTSIDYTIVAKRDGVCYGAWRGTTPKWDDWSQNFDFFTTNVENCAVHQGFDGAYSERDLVDATMV